MAARDEVSMRKAIAWMQEAGRNLAKGQRKVAAAMMAIEHAKADGYSTNTGYDTPHSGASIAPDGSVPGSTPATLTQNEWLLDLQDQILADCKAAAAVTADILDLCNRAPGSKDPKAFDRLRCSGGVDPWGDPTCIRMAVTGVSPNGISTKSDHPYPGLCGPCDRRRRRYLGDPEGYKPKVERFNPMGSPLLHELRLRTFDGVPSGYCICAHWEIAYAASDDAIREAHASHCVGALVPASTGDTQ